MGVRSLQFLFDSVARQLHRIRRTWPEMERSDEFMDMGESHSARKSQAFGGERGDTNLKWNYQRQTDRQTDRQRERQRERENVNVYVRQGSVVLEGNMDE